LKEILIIKISTASSVRIQLKLFIQQPMDGTIFIAKLIYLSIKLINLK